MTTKCSHIDTTQALAAIIASSARIAVLRVFVVDPYHSYYQRQIEGVTGLPIRAVQRELDRMMKAGLLFRHMEGNRAYYQLDQEFPLFAELKALILKASSSLDRLRSMLADNPSVVLALADEKQRKFLIGLSRGDAISPAISERYTVEVVEAGEIVARLRAGDPTLISFLTRGTDILGHRDNVLWRHIETAGYNVEKGLGVP